MGPCCHLTMTDCQHNLQQYKLQMCVLDVFQSSNAAVERDTEEQVVSPARRGMLRCTLIVKHA
jgi:hypothetical protein